jgi:hypothetical protein
MVRARPYKVKGKSEKPIRERLARSRERRVRPISVPYAFGTVLFRCDGPQKHRPCRKQP